MSTLGPEKLADDLREAGFQVAGPVSSNNQAFVIVKDYVIHGGHFDGVVIDIAVPASPDYPTTAPTGLYPSKALVPAGKLQVHAGSWAQKASALPSAEWLYWSRPIPSGLWKHNGGGKCLKAHWIRVFKDSKLNGI